MAAAPTTSRLAALHAFLRRASSTIGDDGVPPALRTAVRAYRVIDASLPSTVRSPSGAERGEAGSFDRSVREHYWRALDALAFAADSIATLRGFAVSLCASTDSWRADLVLARVADALALGWDAYGRDIWSRVSPTLASCVATCANIVADSDADAPRIVLVPSSADWCAGVYRTSAGSLVVVDVARHRRSDLPNVIRGEIASASGVSLGAP